MRVLKTPVILLLLLLLCLPLNAGCGSKKNSADTQVPPQYSPLRALVPEAPGTDIIETDGLRIDISRKEQGYMTAFCTSDDKLVNVKLDDPQGVTYSYFVNPGESAVIPFTGGNGVYLLTGYQQISGSRYAALISQSLEIYLENDFYPFLYPNQYVNFTPETQAVKTALSMLPDETEDIEALDAIYRLVTRNITYDDEKARTVEPGYLPDIDETLATGKGICFDYAALITAMLRARDIPCKLQIGYAGQVKHAWIDVYIRSVGWVNKAVRFDDDTWTRLDPTFDSNAEDKEAVQDFIGDGSNYNVQFTR